MARTVRSRISPQRRKLVWAQTTLTDTAFAVATNRTTDLLAGLVAAGGSTQGCTIMRIHCSFVTTSVQAAVFGSRLVQGFAVRSTTADNPVTAPFADWMLNATKYAGDNGAASVAAAAVNAGTYDIRSKRKCDEVGQTLFHSMVWVLGAGGAETTASYQAQFRVLIALP